MKKESRKAKRKKKMIIDKIPWDLFIFVFGVGGQKKS